MTTQVVPELRLEVFDGQFALSSLGEPAGCEE